MNAIRSKFNSVHLEGSEKFISLRQDNCLSLKSNCAGEVAAPESCEGPLKKIYSDNLGNNCHQSPVTSTNDEEHV